MKQIYSVAIVIFVISAIVMSSGCFADDGEKTGKNADATTYITYLAANATEAVTIAMNGQNSQSTDQNTQTQTGETGQNTGQSSQTSSKTSTQSSSQSGSTSTTQSCSHPSIKTVYVGLDKSSGKIIYDTYCSKCGEPMGRVLY